MMFMHFRVIRTYLVVLLLLVCAGAHAQSTKEYEARKAKLEKEIAIIDKQLAENESKTSTLLSDLVLLRKNVSNRKELVAESDKQIKDLNNQIYAAQKQINKLQARVDTLAARYSKLVHTAYKHRDARVWYMYLFASENIGQAFRRLGYFRNISNHLKTEAVKLREAKAELEAERDKLSRMKDEAQAVRKARAAELTRLSNEEKKVANVTKRLQSDRKKYQSQLNAKKKEINALNREIERLIAEAMGGGKSSSSKSSKKTDPIDMKLDAQFANNKGKLPWPADGPVVSRFGKQYHPVYKNLELPPNKGFDIALGKGSQINCVFDGVVKQVIVMPGYNQCVLVQHGKYFTFYCKLESVTVKAGDKVKTGQVIGVIDTINGQSQLHFQVWRENTPENPETWLR